MTGHTGGTLRFPRLLGSDWQLFVDISYTRSYPIGGNAGGRHEALYGINSRAGRLGASRFVALGNKQRRPSLCVGAFPDVDVGTAVREQLHNPREVAIGSAVHCGV